MKHFAWLLLFACSEAGPVVATKLQSTEACPVTGAVGETGITLESPTMRVVYGDLISEQKGSHSIYGWDGAWVRLTSSWYGDYTYWGSTINSPPTSEELIVHSASFVEARYTFNVAGAVLTKRVALQGCERGVFVHLSSAPANPCCERELGWGPVADIAYGDVALFKHPEHGTTTNLGALLGGATYSIGEGWLRWISTTRPMTQRTLQFSPGWPGIHVISAYDAQPGDGFQTFLGAIPWPHPYEFVGPGQMNASWIRPVSVDLPVGSYAIWIEYTATRSPLLNVTINGETTANYVRHGSGKMKVAEAELLGPTTISLHAVDDAITIPTVYVLPR